MAKRSMFVAIFFVFMVSSVCLANAKSQEFVDYVSQYNKASKPVDLNSTNNAAQDYLNAKEVFIDFREQETELELGLKKFSGVHFAKREDQLQADDMLFWPENLSKEKLQLLRKLVSDNTRTLELVHSGANKLYYWVERKSKNDSMVGILIPHLQDLYDMVYLLFFRAKLQAMEGNIKGAAKDIVAAYRMADQLSGPKTLVEQKIANDFKSKTIQTVLMIIDNAEIDSHQRQLLFNSLQKCTEDETYEPDLLVMKYLSLDGLQRMYVLNEDDQLIWDERESRRQIAMFNLQTQALRIHSRASIGKHFDVELAKIDYIKSKELLSKGLEELQQWIFLEAYPLKILLNEEQSFLQKAQRSHPLLNILFCQAYNLKFVAHESLRAQIRGLNITSAVLKFQDDAGKLPDSLAQLKEVCLLSEIPIDPFSGSAMKYKKVEDGFTVYSYGRNFEDDNGKNQLSFPFGSNEPKGDLVIWPVEKEHNYPF